MTFKHEDKTYSVDATAGILARCIKLPNGTVLGIEWSEALPPSAEAIVELPQEGDDYSDAVMASEV